MAKKDVPKEPWPELVLRSRADPSMATRADPSPDRGEKAKRAPRTTRTRKKPPG